MATYLIKYLFANLTDEQARWRTGAGRWSLLEVINHLYGDGDQARIHLSRSQFDSDNDFFCSATRVVTTQIRDDII